MYTPLSHIFPCCHHLQLSPWILVQTPRHQRRYIPCSWAGTWLATIQATTRASNKHRAGGGTGSDKSSSCQYIVEMCAWIECGVFRSALAGPYLWIVLMNNVWVHLNTCLKFLILLMVTYKEDFSLLSKQWIN